MRVLVLSAELFLIVLWLTSLCLVGVVIAIPAVLRFLVSPC